MTFQPKIQLWSASENGATEEAEQLLAQSAERNQAAMIDLGHGQIHLGWHPLLGRFTVSRRSDDAPAHLPLYLASLDEARQVHHTGPTAEAAVEALVALFQRVAAQLPPDA